MSIVLFSDRDPEKVQLNDRDNPYAFVLGDIIFLAGNKRTVNPHTKALKNQKTAFFVEKKYRVQKNGHNGETKLLARNTAHPHLCSVKNRLDIINRFRRLVGKSVTNCPLAIYKDKKTAES